MSVGMNKPMPKDAANVAISKAMAKHHVMDGRGD